MLLKDCELSPAVVLTADDPKKLGRIKCVIPGILDNSTMSEENMPWAYPFGMGMYQSFSKPIAGQKVWTLINKKNYNEYWYLPFFEYNEKTKEYLDGTYGENPDVLMCRHDGNAASMITYDSENGFSTRIGENHINLMQDSHIELLGGEGQVDINGGDVKIGNTSDEYKSIVLYEPLKDIFNNLNTAFLNLMTAALGDPHTMGLSDGFQQCSDACKEIEKAMSHHSKAN